MKNIGIVGLGVMGAGMAQNFLKAGHSVCVWNRSPEKSSSFEKKGATACKTPKEVAQKSDIIFEITANDDSSRAVWTGEDGIVSGADVHTTVIASGTFSVEWIDELINLCSQNNLTFFDMPVTGGRVGAETGKLRMLVGGEEDKLTDLEPVLKAISSKVFYLGPAGHGIRYKLILNMLQAVHMVGFGEAMKIAKAHKMNLKKVAEGLVDRPGGEVTGVASEAYFQKPDDVTFMVQWMLKDLTYAKTFSELIETPLLDDALEAYTQATERGLGGEDWSAVAGTAK